MYLQIPLRSYETDTRTEAASRRQARWLDEELTSQASCADTIAKMQCQGCSKEQSDCADGLGLSIVYSLHNAFVY